MRFRLRYSMTSLMFLTLFTIAACSKSSSEDDAEGGPEGFQRSRSQIPLSAVQTEAGCLNASLYAMALRQLRPDLPLLEASTNFSLSSGRGVRDAFRLLSAFGNFKFEQRGSSDRIDMQGWSQDGCKTLLHTAADGSEEKYRITDSQPDFLVAESESGNRRSFRWLSDTRVELTSRYNVLDLPCSNGSAFAEVRQILDWSGVLPATLDRADPRYVEDAYLDSLASAVGANSADYYQVEADGSRVLLTAKLQELAAASVRPDLLTCNGSTPTPPAPPPEPEDPTGPIPPIEPPPVDPVDPVDPEDPTGPRPVFPGPLAAESDWL